MRCTVKPNVFVVGAPKSGTTALYAYLRQHPEVFMCSPKEPQFFAGDICGHQREITTMAEYLGLFENTDEAVAGEASTCYLGSPQAPREIQAFCPEARIIAMLRNPIDVMYAEHSERIFQGFEHISEFEAALDSNESRRWRSGRFKGECVRRLNYRELAMFSQQVKRFVHVFGRPNVHIVIYEDFAANPALIYKEVLDFLRVWPHHQCAFDVVNANRQIRSRLVQDVLRDPPEIVRSVVRSLLSQRTRRSVANFLNVKVKPRPPLNQQFREQLESEFEHEVQQLSDIVGRDLSRIWFTAK